MSWGIKLAEFKYNAMTKYPLDDDNAYEKIVCLKRAYEKMTGILDENHQ